MPFDEAEDYFRSSRTQKLLGWKLIEVMKLQEGERVLDVGCGTGRMDLDLVDRFPGTTVHGIDSSADMIRVANNLAQSLGETRVSFECADAITWTTAEKFDVIVSNSAMHWVLPAETGYRNLYEWLRPGGRMFVGTSGAGTYKGLRDCALEVAHSMGFKKSFAHWSYPTYYPRPEVLHRLLDKIGFENVEVRAYELNDPNDPYVVEDFSVAGLLPFLEQIPTESRSAFRERFVEHAKKTHPSFFANRLNVTANRPGP